MAETTVIQSFLAELGFKVDENTLSKFIKALKGGATESVAFGEIWAKTAEQVGKAAEAVVKAVLEITQELDTLYFASRRIGNSVENIREFSFAMEQMGSSASSAVQALDSFSTWYRQNALSAMPIMQMVTRGTGYRIRPGMSQKDMLDALMGAEHKHLTSKNPAEVALGEQFLSMTGLNEAQVMQYDEGKAKKAAEFTERLDKLLGQFGFDSKQAALNADAFNTELKNLHEELDTIGIAIFSSLMPAFTAVAKWLEDLPQLILDVQDTDFAQTVEHFGEAVGHLVMSLVRLVEFIVKTLAPVFKDWKVDWDTVKAAVDFLTDTMNVFADLLSGDWSKAWQDFAKSGVDATRAIAKSIEGAILLQARLMALVNPALMPLVDQLQQWADAQINKFAPDQHPDMPGGSGIGVGPGGGPSVGAAPTPSGKTSKLSASRLAAGSAIENYMLKSGVRPDLAKAIAGGVIGEGGDLQLGYAKNGAFGLGQWRGSRLQELFRRYGQHPTFEQQEEFLRWEATEGGDKGSAAFMRSHGVQQATWAYDVALMRPDLPGAGHTQALGDFNRSQAYYLQSGGTGDSDNSISQTTTITVNGATDADKTAQAIGSAQQKINERLAQKQLPGRSGP